MSDGFVSDMENLESDDESSDLCPDDTDEDPDYLPDDAGPSNSQAIPGNLSLTPSQGLGLPTVAIMS